MGKRVQLWCVWAGPVFLVAYAIAFWGIAGFIPPPAPSSSAAHIAARYAEHRTGIRVGMLLGMIASFLIVPFFAIISVQIARAEQRWPILAVIQFGCALILEVYFVLCSMLWLAATYRPELDVATIRMLNDLGWLIFVMVFPGYVIQMLCIAVAAFTDRSPHPVFPRWVGWLCVWVALSGCGGGFAVFVKSGPLAWNGAVGFYIPLSVFAVWMSVMTYVLHTGISRATDLDAPVSAARVPAVPMTSAG